MIPCVNVTLPPRNAETITSVEYVQPPDILCNYGLLLAMPSASVSASADTMIDDINELEGDWDGYGGLAITPESCAHARRILALTPSKGMPAPEVGPTSNGTITLEWDSSEGEAYLEIGRTRYSGHVQPKDAGPVYLEGQLASPATAEQILAIINQLLYGASASNAVATSVQIAAMAY